jgi:hypothetical protein
VINPIIREEKTRKGPLTTPVVAVPIPNKTKISRIIIPTNPTPKPERLLKKRREKEVLRGGKLIRRGLINLLERFYDI